MQCISLPGHVVSQERRTMNYPLLSRGPVYFRRTLTKKRKNEAERERRERGGGEHDYRIQWSRKREWRLGRWFDLLGPMEEESKEHRASARARAMPQPQTKATKSTRSWGKTRSGGHWQPRRTRTKTCSRRNTTTMDLARCDEGRGRPLLQSVSGPYHPNIESSREEYFAKKKEEEEGMLEKKARE